MKKITKSLLLAALVAFGLNFCGVFGGDAWAAKSTTIKYSQEVTKFNGSTYSKETINTSTTVSGDVVGLSCSDNTTLRIDTDLGKNSFRQITSLKGNTGDGSTQCEKTAYSLISQFESNGVTVAQGAVWVDSYPPTSTGANGTTNKPVFVAVGKRSTEADTFVKPKLKLVNKNRTTGVNMTQTDVSFTAVHPGEENKTFTIYMDMSNVKNQLKGIFDVEEDSSPQTPGNQQTPGTQKPGSGDGGNQTPGTQTPGTQTPGSGDGGNQTPTKDPVVPTTSNQEYPDVDTKASILVGCSHAEQIFNNASGNWEDDSSKSGNGIKCLINLVVDIMTVGVGILSVIGITIVGIQYLSAGDSEERTRKAKRRLFEIVIGVALYVVAYAAIKWLLPAA